MKYFVFKILSQKYLALYSILHSTAGSIFFFLSLITHHYKMVTMVNNVIYFSSVK